MWITLWLTLCDSFRAITRSLCCWAGAMNRGMPNVIYAGDSSLKLQAEVFGRNSFGCWNAGRQVAEEVGNCSRSWCRRALKRLLYWGHSSIFMVWWSSFIGHLICSFDYRAVITSDCRQIWSSDSFRVWTVLLGCFRSSAPGPVMDTTSIKAIYHFN